MDISFFFHSSIENNINPNVTHFFLHKLFIAYEPKSISNARVIAIKNSNVYMIIPIPIDHRPKPLYFLPLHFKHDEAKRKRVSGYVNMYAAVLHVLER